MEVFQPYLAFFNYPGQSFAGWNMVLYKIFKKSKNIANFEAFMALI